MRNLKIKAHAHIRQYALNELEQALSISIRKTTWLPLDEAWAFDIAFSTKTIMFL